MLFIALYITNDIRVLFAADCRLCNRLHTELACTLNLTIDREKPTTTLFIMTTATIRSGTINLLNTIIGAGILAMPYGIKQNGLILGCLLITWSACTSAFGLYLQNKVAKYVDQRGSVLYFSLSQLTYPHLSVVFDGAIAIKCFGVGVSYLVVIGDLMPKIMETLKVDGESVLMARNFWISLFMAVLVVPLSYLKKLDSLKYTSVVALFSVAYLICLVVGHTIANDVEATAHVKRAVAEGVHWGPLSFLGTLRSFPVFVFAYTCHQNMFAIINELKAHETSGSQTRQSNIIIRNAIATACTSYLVVGLCGYISFGSKVTGNIVAMYPTDSILSLIGRLCIVIMVSLSFPLQCHPCRGSINHIIYFISNGIHDIKSQSGYQQIEDMGEEVNVEEVDELFITTTPMEGAHDTDGHDPMIVPLSKRNFYIITTFIVVLAYLVAITVTSLEHVLAFVGSTGSTSISLDKLERFCKYGGLALSIWGVVVMVVCLGATIFLGATH